MNTPNNLEVRLLHGDSEVIQAMDILRSHPHVSGVPAGQFDWKFFFDFLHNNVVNGVKPEYRSIGAFEDGVLKGFVVQLMGTLNSVWYITMLSQVHSGWLNNGHGDYVNACLVEAASHAESKKHWDCLYCLPYKWGRTAGRTQSRSPVWTRYDSFVEGVYAANTTPKFGQHAAAMGAPKPNPVVIKRACLKNEFRLEYYAKEGYTW